MSEAIWARGEFLKLYTQEPELTLCAAKSELDELVQVVLPELKFSDMVDGRTIILGMHIEVIPKGWYVQDVEGNQIGQA